MTPGASRRDLAIVLTVAAASFALSSWGLSNAPMSDDVVRRRALKHAIGNLDFLPGDASRGGVAFDIAELALLPRAIAQTPAATRGIARSARRHVTLPTTLAPVRAMQADLVEHVDAGDTASTTRLLFLALALGAAPIVWAAARRARPHRPRAALAAGVLFAISPAALFASSTFSGAAPMLLFGALSLWATVALATARTTSSRATPRSDLIASALAGAAAGLALGCGVGGVACVAGALVADALTPPPPPSASSRRTDALVIAASAVVAWLATSPGVVLDPLRTLFSIARSSPDLGAAGWVAIPALALLAGALVDAAFERVRAGRK